jgi:hypothetical protein
MSTLDIAPLMYGFVRVAMVTGPMAGCERQLCEYAQDRGFELGTVFHDRGDGGAFEELLCELVRSEARHVVVPTMEHLTGLPVPRDQLLIRLQDIGTSAWAVAEPATPIEPAWRFDTNADLDTNVDRDTTSTGRTLVKTPRSSSGFMQSPSRFIRNTTRSTGAGPRRRR